MKAEEFCAMSNAAAAERRLMVAVEWKVIGKVKVKLKKNYQSFYWILPLEVADLR